MQMNVTQDTQTKTVTYSTQDVKFTHVHCKKVPTILHANKYIRIKQFKDIHQLVTKN